MTSTIKVNNIQNQCGANIINESSNTITIGASGDTIALASGASQTGFGRTGTVDWQTGSIKTGNFTAVSGEGYFVNTTSGAITVTLPASPSGGDIVAVKDYAQTFATNNCTIARNSSNIEGVADDVTLDGNAESVTFVYVDSTKGWLLVNEATTTYGQQFVAATGGSVATCGNFKIHTFTGPGTFCVSNAGNPSGSNTVEYIVVAGGGGGGQDVGGGGGAGGFRFASPSLAPLTYPGKPLAAPAGLPVSVQGYPIAVGGGGAGGNQPTPTARQGTQGVTSTFSTISSAGGGFGGGNPAPNSGGDGGSGGGAARGSGSSGGTGNTPPTSPAQGLDGGNSGPGCGHAGGGGGAIVAGTAGNTNPGTPGVGQGGNGAGIPDAFGASNGVANPSPDGFRYYAGGGSGGIRHPIAPNTTKPGGLGGGGTSTSGSAPVGNSSGGTANTGGGAGGSGSSQSANGAAGGSGIVIIRYKFQ